MPSLVSFHGLAQNLFSVFQSGGAKFSNHDQLRPDVLVYKLRAKLLRGYHRAKHNVFCFNPHAAPGTTDPQLHDLESQHSNAEQVTNVGRAHGATSLHPLRSVNSHVTLEADNSDIEGGQQDVRGGPDPDHASFVPRTRMWMAMFVSLVLSLIIVPGLVVGLMTRQMSWGVELSGAIAPIVSLLAGLYYHAKK